MGFACTGFAVPRDEARPGYEIPLTPILGFAPAGAAVLLGLTLLRQRRRSAGWKTACG